MIIKATPSYPRVEDILARVQPALSEEQAAHVRRAYDIAEAAHEGQQRASGEPYFSHCAEVTMLLADLVADWPTLAAGLLHDTIEDCGFTEKKIEGLMPAPVAELVDGVTKVSKIHFATDREHQAGNLRKMILAMARDVRVVLIKLCDRLHNMRTLGYLEPGRRKIIATGTIEIYAPLANRLGMESISDELEDLAMSHLQPVIFKRLGDHLKRNKEHYEGIIEQTVEIVRDALGRDGVSADVSARLKHIYSIYEKMRRQSLGLSEIHDLLAMRIITATVAETYEALGIVHAKWKPVEGRFKDYIASPKPNGYRSIHTTVIGVEGELTEIQLRTREMDKIAAEGVAAHWKYKEAGSEKSAGDVEAKKLAWLRQLVDWLSDIRDPDEFMAAIKHDVFEASVFCYTPVGDVVELPRGSSVLDFAYRIHTEVGNHCSGSKVNHKMVPMRTVLKTGDIAEVITSKSAHPTVNWLQIAHTNRARNKIRHWLKTHNRDEYLARGRVSFLESLRRRAPEMSEAEAKAQLDLIAARFSLAKGEDVLVEIGFGSIKPGTVLSKIVPPDPQTPAGGKPLGKKPAKDAKPGSILVEGMPGALTRFAMCCSPQPGDPISGFVTRGRGISIHREDCPSLRHSREMRPDGSARVVPVQWSDGSARLLPATLNLVCQDRRGLLKDITHTLDRLSINIIDSEGRSNPRTGQAKFKLKILVEDEEELNMVTRRLETIESVRSLSRVIHRR